MLLCMRLDSSDLQSAVHMYTQQKWKNQSDGSCWPSCHDILINFIISAKITQKHLPFIFFFKNCAYVQPTIIRRTGFVKFDGHIKRSSMQNLLKFKKYHKFNWSLKLQALVKDALALWRNVIKCNHLVLLHLKCVQDKKINNWF